ncbi:MAG: hypothetical protein ISR65_01000 [Bacteriovoracaceae bacterium]|nr:hypothetical protein [Bacteriovoracaceae bacterium]
MQLGSKHPIIFFALAVLLQMLTSSLNLARGSGEADFGDDMNIGGDIFDDFNEDIEATRVLEDERFYRYGRFFSFNLGLGLTDFDGNRGAAYDNEPPTYGLSLYFFSDFKASYGIGVEYSKHHFILDRPVNAHHVFIDEDAADPEIDMQKGVGLIEVNLIRIYFAYRYYLDTANLGTAITYSNPYATARAEYWYANLQFTDQKNYPDDKGGGMGIGFGGGFDFPIRLKETYLNVEFLLHLVNFHDKFTHDYAPVPNGTFGYDDMTGSVYSVMVSYVMSW